MHGRTSEGFVRCGKVATEPDQFQRADGFGGMAANEQLGKFTSTRSRLGGGAVLLLAAWAIMTEDGPTRYLLVGVLLLTIGILIKSLSSVRDRSSADRSLIE
jgi:hypothetical protein